MYILHFYDSSVNNTMASFERIIDFISCHLRLFICNKSPLKKSTVKIVLKHINNNDKIIRLIIVPHRFDSLLG